VAAWLLVDRAAVRWVILPVTLASVLGTALSILLAVRANTGYQRWWEASGIWAQITALSRNLARVVISIGDSKRAAGQNAEAVAAFQRGMIEGQIAWVNALRLQLRGQSDWASLAPRLSEEEYRTVADADNKLACCCSCIHSASTGPMEPGCSAAWTTSRWRSPWRRWPSNRRWPSA
jgi:putative membrane protein